MQIIDILFAPGLGAFFYDDQAAIRGGPSQDGFTYAGVPVTPGFAAIRVPAESLGVGLRLADGHVAWGDMMSVQYSGASGREPLFSANSAERYVARQISPRLVGADLRSFRDACQALPIDTPLAVRYGLTQALLWAVAHGRGQTPAEVICEEFGLPVRALPVPVFAQSGDERRVNVDKMILKQVEVLPHALINTEAKFGPKGETLREFARWTAGRVRHLGSADYAPRLHFDVYGWIGGSLGLRPETIADFILALEGDVAPFVLHVECPADFGSRQDQIDGYAEICELLRRKGGQAKIVADERCNTLADIEAFAAAGAGDILQIKTPDVGGLEQIVEAVLACHRHGRAAYLGGSCAETDLSARTCVHIAVATQADMMLAKPGMGVDEGVSIVRNEQSRLLAVLARAAAA